MFAVSTPIPSTDRMMSPPSGPCRPAMSTSIVLPRRQSPDQNDCFSLWRAPYRPGRVTLN
jgi:hypothetical protein